MGLSQRSLLAPRSMSSEVGLAGKQQQFHQTFNVSKFGFLPGHIHAVPSGFTSMESRVPGCHPSRAQCSIATHQPHAGPPQCLQLPPCPCSLSWLCPAALAVTSHCLLHLWTCPNSADIPQAALGAGGGCECGDAELSAGHSEWLSHRERWCEGRGEAKSQLDFQVISQPLWSAPPSSSSPPHFGMFQCFWGNLNPSPNPSPPPPSSPSSEFPLHFFSSPSPCLLSCLLNEGWVFKPFLPPRPAALARCYRWDKCSFSAQSSTTSPPVLGYQSLLSIASAGLGPLHWEPSSSPLATRKTIVP